MRLLVVLMYNDNSWHRSNYWTYGGKGWFWKTCQPIDMYSTKANIKICLRHKNYLLMWLITFPKNIVLVQLIHFYILNLETNLNNTIYAQWKDIKKMTWQYHNFNFENEHNFNFYNFNFENNIILIFKTNMIFIFIVLI